MKQIILSRLIDNGNQTTGQACLCDGFKTHIYFSTLELPNKNNRKWVSCIPAGKYMCKVRQSDKYGTHLHIQDVPGRSMILMHYGNYNSDTKGCILVGEKFAKLNKDDDFDVTNSRKTMKKILDFINGDDNIELIINEPLKYI